MARLGRPKKALTKSNKEMYRYMHKRYIQKKKSEKDSKLGNRDSLKVQLTKLVRMTQDEVNKFPPKSRLRLFRWMFHAQQGIVEIPVEYLSTNEDMAHYCAEHSGEGSFIIKSGYPAKYRKNCVWRGLIWYNATVREDNSLNVKIIKEWNQRLRHYWFRKINLNALQ